MFGLHRKCVSIIEYLSRCFKTVFDSFITVDVFYVGVLRSGVPGATDVCDQRGVG